MPNWKGLSSVPSELRAALPVDHSQFHKRVPSLLERYYLVRREGDPAIGIIFLNKQGLAEVFGEPSIEPQKLIDMELAYYFGPALEIQADNHHDPVRVEARGW